MSRSCITYHILNCTQSQTYGPNGALSARDCWPPSARASFLRLGGPPPSFILRLEALLHPRLAALHSRWVGTRASHSLLFSRSSAAASARSVEAEGRDKAQIDHRASEPPPLPPKGLSDQMGTSVQVTPLSGAYGEGPLCYLLAVDGFRFLLDCGWTDLCDTSQLQPLAKYTSSFSRDLSA